MEKPAAPGFEIRIDGVWRTFRDQQAAAYDAASRPLVRFLILHLLGKNDATGTFSAFAMS